MREQLNVGDVRTYERLIREEDCAAFHGEEVHPVLSTFALGRDVEFCSRQFILDIRQDDEEGVGTYLNIIHKSPAFVGETLSIRAIVKTVSDHELICTFQASTGNRPVAEGETGQKLLKKEKLRELFRRE